MQTRQDVGSVTDEESRKRAFLRQAPSWKFVRTMSCIYDMWENARQEEDAETMRVAADALYRWAYNCYREMGPFIDRFQARCLREEMDAEPELSRLETIRAGIAYNLDRFAGASTKLF